MSSGENTSHHGSRAPGSPTSLKSPEAATAALRRALADVTAGDENGAPDNTLVIAKRERLGFGTRNRKWLHIVVHLKGAASSVAWRLYTFDHLAGLWCLDTRPGTAGTVSLVATDDDNPQKSILAIVGTDRVYLELDGIVDAGGDGIDVWLGSSDDA